MTETNAVVDIILNRRMYSVFTYLRISIPVLKNIIAFVDEQLAHFGLLYAAERPQLPMGGSVAWKSKKEDSGKVVIPIEGVL